MDTSPQGAPGGASAIPNYLVQAILVTIFCCPPVGIPAIVFASQVNGKAAAGDQAGALAASSNARKWCWIAFWAGIAFAAILILLNVVFGLALFDAAASGGAIEIGGGSPGD